MFSCLKNNVLAVAVAGSLIAAGSASAFNANDGLDGAWYDQSKPGEGVYVDVLTGGSAPIGSFAYYTYGDDNKPVWLLFATPMSHGKFEDVDVNMYMGDDRSNATKVGKATGGFESCSSLKMTIDMNDGTGLQDVTIDYTPGATNLGFAANPMCSEAPALASCPEGTTASGDACQLPNEISGNMYLPAGKDYVLKGQVNVVSGGTLTIAPGVKVMGDESNAAHFLVIQTGAKIYANGTADMPITFTSHPSRNVAGGWAGLVIAGNSTCNDAANGQQCEFEAIPGIKYGGEDLTDSSGSLSYVRVLNAGFETAPDEELNAFTFLGVGSGTTLHHLQADNGTDDGFEFFGGSANAKYLVCTNMADDCLDLDQGYSGNIQFALVYQGKPDAFTSSPRGIEADNDKSNNDKTPRTSAKLSNVTLVGSGQGGAKADAIHLRRGFGGQVWNTVATGYEASCLNIADQGTYNAKDDGLALAGNVIGNCGGGAIKSNDGYDSAALYNDGTNNKVEDGLELDGYMPKEGASFLTNGVAAPVDFFAPVPYSGAFSGPNDDWTKGWTIPFMGR